MFALFQELRAGDGVPEHWRYFRHERAQVDEAREVAVYHLRHRRRRTGRRRKHDKAQRHNYHPGDACVRCGRRGALYGQHPLHQRGGGKRRGLRIGITKAEREHYRELLKSLDLGLEDRLTARVGLLSGGQRQALTLLMATMNKPKLLLLDEHTAALDPKTALKVLTLSAKIVEENHLTTMMITHNMKDAIKYGNRLIMMYEGHIIYDVSGEEKKKLQVSDLLAKFQIASGGEFANDRMILS